MKILRYNSVYVIGLVIILLAFYIGTSYKEFLNQQAFGSVSVTSEYYATSTGEGVSGGDSALGSFSYDRRIKNGPGVIGQITITGLSSGIMHFYDATTSKISERAATKSTSSIFMLSVPASTTAGTYVFDAIFEDGLYVDTFGKTPTSTITYR